MGMAADLMAKVDFRKFFRSFVEPVAWWKTARFAIGLAALILGGFTIYRAYFMPSQKNTQTITVGQGGTATIVQNKAEKSNHGLEPFIELYGQVDDQNEGRAGIRCGVRLF